MVLGAGKGTRLFPLTGEIPSLMDPAADKPIVQHIFERLSEAGCAEVHGGVHYLTDVLLR